MLLQTSAPMAPRLARLWMTMLVCTGYQAFWNHRRTNLVLELATKKDFGGSGNDSVAIGYQLQQAVGQYFQIQIESFYTFNNLISDGAGARFES
ncbi:MAG: hypothetical protein CM1200mP4_1910 [Rhodospirillaceae bacterium]|nr:MAG: hypothetical protein CM1200mP4_1910 [Rhodospirillaceae bacterium]